MRHGRSGHLIRTIILVVLIAAAFIIASATIRYNRRAGWFDSPRENPARHSLAGAMRKEAR